MFTFIKFSIIVGLLLAFLDESLRKVIPGNPVAVTAVKDALFFLAGLTSILMDDRGLRRNMFKFAPWTVLTFLSAFFVFASLRSVLLLAASLRTYTLSPLFFAAGYSIGRNPGLLKASVRIFIVFGAVTVAVALLQEYARETLPEVLSMRIYFEKHSESGGLYVESLFASPQTLGEVAALMATWCFAEAVFGAGVSRPMLALLSIIPLFYTIYVSRIRSALLLVLLAFLAVFAIGLARLGVSKRLLMLAKVGALLSALLLGAVSWQRSTQDSSSEAGAAKDVDYYGASFAPNELIERLSYFMVEYEFLRNHNFLIGYGAGTGSLVTECNVPNLSEDIPQVTDTGLFLIYHEYGVVGLACFGLSYLILSLLIVYHLCRIHVISISLIASGVLSILFLAWFLFKSYTIMRNGFSHAMWLGSMGLFYGLMAELDGWNDAVKLYGRALGDGSPRLSAD